MIHGLCNGRAQALGLVVLAHSTREEGGRDYDDAHLIVQPSQAGSDGPVTLHHQCEAASGERGTYSFAQALRAGQEREKERETKAVGYVQSRTWCVASTCLRAAPQSQPAIVTRADGQRELAGCI
ncbi:hypothetical protein XA68_14281 [Ophiocordyceps unilateralis]|uniref:Uncharacterized protein n=1 Tax=Ophiocordyceps unilateralis TaxID=268505 RepID=A0A2A9PN99_OPHUN|nr:hypothetical protein XA68_14281 [Ophiocordyceps unilateralis]